MTDRIVAGHPAQEPAPATSGALAQAPERPLVPLLTPRDGVPPVLTSTDELARAAQALAAAEGPVAADAERASGFRYGQHNYLVQLRREGAGTFLIDTTALPDLSIITEALHGVEWVFHAASQDLLPMAEQRLFPDRLFDTELAARLLGMPRVGLGAVIADVLGLQLRKEHSASDWSRRPLPAPWLEYAALDVEVLVELRERLGERLEEAGKAEWAAQEFEAVRTAPPPAPRPEPWRRTSGTHGLRDRRQLAIVRALWHARDTSARARDIAPGRVLPDRAIVAAAAATPRTVGQLVTLPEFAGKAARRRAAVWQRAIDEAMALPADRLPSLRGPRTDGPPPPRAWADRDPVAARRLAAAREIVAGLSEQLAVPVENLLQPDALRRLCWTPPEPATPDAVAEFLRGRGARPWQVGLLAERLAAAFAAVPGEAA